MRKWLLSLAVLALVASPALAGRYNQVISPGDKAPDFSGLPALTPQGEDASLSLGDLQEDVVVVVFLANHCPVVVNYEDRIIDFVEAYKDKPIRVVGIACTAPGTPQYETDNLDAIRDRMQEKGYNYIYGYDESGRTGRAYGATVTPEFFVLDKDRVIRYTGALDDHQQENRVTTQHLRDAVDAVLAGRQVEVAETRPVGCTIKYPPAR